MFEDRERRRVLAEAAAGRLETLATELEQLLASDQPVEEVVARWRGLRRDADVLREHAPANVVGRRAARARRRRARGEGTPVSAGAREGRAGQPAAAAAAVSSGRDAGGGGADHAQGRRSRAARDPHGDRGARAAAVEEGSSGDSGAARGRARRARAARAGTARRRRVAALGQPPGAGRDLQGDGGAQGRREPRCRRPPDARAAGALEAGGAGAARAGRGRCGGGSRPRRTRCSRGRPRTSRRRTRSASQTWPASRRCASEPRRSPTRPTGSRRPPRFRRCRPSGRASVPSRADTRRRSGSGSAPRAIASSRAVRKISSAARKSGRRTSRARKRCARRPRRWPIRPSGRAPRRSSSSCRPSGRRSVRSASHVGSDLAALPRRVRSILRSLQASRSARAAGEGRGSRHGHPRARSAGARGRRGRELRRPRTSTRPFSRRGASGSRRRSCRARCSRISPRAITRRSAASSRSWPGAFAGTDLDPETTRKRMEKLLSRVEEIVSAQPAKPANLSPTELLAQQLRERLAANTMSGGESRRRERGIALARVRAGSAQRAGAVDAPRTGTAEHRRAAQRALPARVPASSSIRASARREAGLPSGHALSRATCCAFDAG